MLYISLYDQACANRNIIFSTNNYIGVYFNSIFFAARTVSSNQWKGILTPSLQQKKTSFHLSFHETVKTKLTKFQIIKINFLLIAIAWDNIYSDTVPSTVLCAFPTSSFINRCWIRHFYSFFILVVGWSNDVKIKHTSYHRVWHRKVVSITTALS